MTNAAPGWYADDANPGFEHWWDGTAYVQTRPVLPSAPPAAGAVATPYVPAPYGSPVYAGPISPKSRTVAAILGFFLGGLGVDRFYLGNIGMGVAKLLLGWLTLGIWPLIDWIIILVGSAHDGEGLPVRRWE